MKTKKDCSSGDSYSYSVNKILPEGVTVTDIYGYFSNEFGDPVFSMSRIVLSNGKTVWCGGEHDIAYMETIPGVSEKQIEILMEED